MTCALCGTPPGDVVYESEVARVVLHEDWSPRGHAMIVSKRHVENPSDLRPAEWAHFTNVWHFTERALLDATGADRMIALKLGILTPHLHVHLYPARTTDTRADVFAMFDGRAGVAREEGFVEGVRHALRNGGARAG